MWKTLFLVNMEIKKIGSPLSAAHVETVTSCQSLAIFSRHTCVSDFILENPCYETQSGVPEIGAVTDFLPQILTLSV